MSVQTRLERPDLTVNALNMAPRRAARALLESGAPVAGVLELADEIHRLGQQVAAVRVDRDRQVKVASERALDCIEHGEMIRAAEEQAYRMSESARQHEDARGALVTVLHALKDALRVLRDKARRGEDLPETAELVEMLAGFLDKASRSHNSAWRRAETKRGKR